MLRKLILAGAALALVACGSKEPAKQKPKPKPTPTKPAPKAKPPVKKAPAKPAEPKKAPAKTAHKKVTVPKVKDLKVVDFATLKTHFKAKVTMVAVWATWCGPCIAEMPHLAEFYESYKAKGFDIIAVSVDDPSDLEEEIQNVLDKIKVPFRVMLLKPETEEVFFKAFGEKYGGKLPATAVFDASGKKLLFTRKGWTKASLAARIEPLLK